MFNIDEKIEHLSGRSRPRIDYAGSVDQDQSAHTISLICCALSTAVSLTPVYAIHILNRKRNVATVVIP